VKPKRGLRAVAILEAVKGVLGVLVGFGLLSILGGRGAHIATELVEWLHLNPEGQYSRIFIDAISGPSPRVWMFFALAVGYTALRFIEAYGLWHARVWAEWIAVASFSIYVPVEIYEIYHGVTWLKVVVLLGNIGIIVFLVWALWSTKHPAPVGEPSAAGDSPLGKEPGIAQ
jgi:uncharacterized membrane protein (DUF2068 family)